MKRLNSLLILTICLIALLECSQGHPLLELARPIVQKVTYIQAAYNYAQWHVFYFLCHWYGWAGILGNDQGKAYLTCVEYFTSAFPVNV